MLCRPCFRLARLAVVLTATLLAGCATTSTPRTADPRDPLESLNRASYAFNDSVDKALVRPVARGYKKVVPVWTQTGVSNFFSNAKYPITLVNNLLQGKLKAAASDTGRFVLNTTFGLGGLLDPATLSGLARNDEDFGQTLGTWGVPPGPYLVVPILGPYSMRDGLARFADDFVEPSHYIEDDSTRWGFWLGDRFDRRVRLLEADAVLDRTGDPYAFVRSAYLQRREYLVRDGNVPVDENEFEDPALEDPEASAQP